jgi:integrase
VVSARSPFLLEKRTVTDLIVVEIVLQIVHFTSSPSDAYELTQKQRNMSPGVYHMLFATMWNTGIRIGEARTLTPESFDLDGLRPFVRVLSEKVRARRGRPPKDEVRLVPLTDASFVRQMESWMVTTRPRRREPLWPVTDETMRNWLKQAVKRAEADGVHFSIPVTPHTFRHSYIMHMLYHRQPRKVIQALAGHKDPRSMEVYTRVFALDMAATLAVPFTGDGRDAAEILRSLPPAG